ncbi:thiamine pyrophosphate-binding protein [Blastococcus sp. Marseille-P5729]|uniref:thiamine pyrophosphate-binding protein n=1 Tax=Blastococcus sp. Marseille-P5729 TaxID=2086582 RepID=UPI0018FEF297|nr:thiamine pyrophosphate-binding protein [Blastococcus sp. Marseille-P5729]
MGSAELTVAEAVGRALVRLGVDLVSGVIGSGNFHVTNAMVAAGARFVATRHEGGAATLADAYSRQTGRPAGVSVHQGCGLTNAITGIGEAAKSRTPLVVVTAEAGDRRSNFWVDQDALAASVGARPHRVTSAETCLDETVAAVAEAVHGRRTVVLNLPLSVQSEIVAADVAAELALLTLPPAPAALEPAPDDVARLTEALRRSRRPVFVAGRGARSASARDALVELAEAHGALLATSAVAKGLFAGDPWSLDVSGGFSTPLAAELISQADLVVGWGCALNMWTMRHGRLIADGATVVQVDDTLEAIGVHRELTFGVHGDVAVTASATLAGSGRSEGWRTDELRERIANESRWGDVPYDDASSDHLIDPRRLCIELDAMLPEQRVVAVDSGNFMGYPSMFLDVPDEDGFCFTQAFQAIGLGLATAIGAALARPDRLTVAALGDGGALMGAAELDTVVRLGLDMLVVVFNDEAYGAEVHHFGPGGHPLDLVVFDETDIAAIGRGYGFEAVTVRSPADLDAVRDWLEGPRKRPMLIDAKVTRDEAAWWLEEAFRGH